MQFNRLKNGHWTILPSVLKPKCDLVSANYDAHVIDVPEAPRNNGFKQISQVDLTYHALGLSLLDHVGVEGVRLLSCWVHM